MTPAESDALAVIERGIMAVQVAAVLALLLLPWAALTWLASLDAMAREDCFAGARRAGLQARWTPQGCVTFKHQDRLPPVAPSPLAGRARVWG